MAREEARRRARAADRPAQPADGIEGACRPRAVPPVKAIALGITPWSSDPAWWLAGSMNNRRLSVLTANSSRRQER